MTRGPDNVVTVIAKILRKPRGTVANGLRPALERQRNGIPPTDGIYDQIVKWDVLRQYRRGEDIQLAPYVPLEFVEKLVTRLVLDWPGYRDGAGA